MNLNEVLRNEDLQLAILDDAISEFAELEHCHSDLIGSPSIVNETGGAAVEELARPVSMIALMASVGASETSGEHSSIGDLKAVASAGTAWWERTWIILTIIFVSPTFRAALWEGNDIQKEWMGGNDTLPSFQKRFESYVCGGNAGAIAVTPLEAVAEEMTLWEYLNS